MTPPRSRGRAFVLPAVSALSCLAVGTASGLITALGLDDWYPSLAKPPGTPPPWVFGPVWSVLYVMMGVALGRLVQRGAWREVRLFGAQLVLNLAWTPVFFGAHMIRTALVVIVALGVVLVVLIRRARGRDPVSARLLVPYLVWVSYATYLNAGMAVLNP